MDNYNLDGDVFTERLHNFPSGFQPTQVISVRLGQRVLFIVAFDREHFWLDKTDVSPETNKLISELEKEMKGMGIVQVR